jgi:hypothetical protein
MSKTIGEEAKEYSIELLVTGKIIDTCVGFAIAHIDHFMEYSESRGLKEGGAKREIISDIRLARQNMRVLIAANRIVLEREAEGYGETPKIKKEKNGKKTP